MTIIWRERIKSQPQRAIKFIQMLNSICVNATVILHMSTSSTSQVAVSLFLLQKELIIPALWTYWLTSYKAAVVPSAPSCSPSRIAMWYIGNKLRKGLLMWICTVCLISGEKLMPVSDPWAMQIFAQLILSLECGVNSVKSIINKIPCNYSFMTMENGKLQWQHPLIIKCWYI